MPSEDNNENDNLEVLKKILKAKESINELSEKTAQQFANMTKSFSTLMSYQEKMEKIKEQELLTQRKLLDGHVLQLSEMKAQGSMDEAALQALEDQIKKQEESIALEEHKVRVMRESAAAGKELGTAMTSALQSQYKTGSTVIPLVKKIVLGFRDWKSLVTSLAMSAPTMMANLVTGMVGFATALVDAEAAFRRTTGASNAFASSIRDSAAEMLKYTVSLEDVSKSMTSLHSGFTDFTMLAKEQRDSLVILGSTLEKLGVSNEDFTKGIQLSNKALGQTTKQARTTQREMVTFAKALGVAPKKMAGDFAKSGDMLAKMGSRGVKSFKDLAHAAKITGFEIDKITQMTNKFDTFEGAATQAGKLNAALGGNFVNAMDLMMSTDPAERFGMIRDSILDAGLSFDDMSYYQKNYYKEALGLSDVGELAMMLSGDMDSLSGATNQTAEELIALQKEAEKNASISERWNAVVNRAIVFGLKFVPIVEMIADNLKLLAIGMAVAATATTVLGVKIWFATKAKREYIKETIKSAAAIIQRTSAQAADTATTGISTAATRTSTARTKANTGAIRTSTAAKQKATKVSKGWNLSLLSTALAAVAIGGAIYFAATGVGNLVSAFSGLGEAAWPAVAGIVAFSASVGTLFGLLMMAGAGPQAIVIGLAVGLLLGVGAAAWMMGEGVESATIGLAAMFDSLSTLGGFSKLGKVAAEIGKIAAAVNSIETNKAISISTVMKTTAAIGNAKQAGSSNSSISASPKQAGSSNSSISASPKWNVRLVLDATQTKQLIKDGATQVMAEAIGAQ